MEYFNLSSRYGQVFTAGIGAEAIRKILENMNLEEEIEEFKKELEDDEVPDKKKILETNQTFSGIYQCRTKAGMDAADCHSGYSAGSSSDGSSGWRTFCDF